MRMIYRNYKDNVFCLLFQDRANLLELYNALNGTDYKDPGELTVVTLPGTVCIQYKNDAAFTFSRELYLCEQQSTENPNMPLRFLHYVSDEYRHIVWERDLYRQNAVRIPAPHFVVFYNGTAPQPERQIYRLSDLYEGQEGEPELEIRVLVLNINGGNNQELLERCRTLREYMQFVDKVRRGQKKMGAEAAVRQAVEACIREGILKEFLEEHKEEVIGVSIWEFKEELYREAMREDALEDGRNEGLRLGLEEGLREGRQEGLREGLREGRREGRREGHEEGLQKGRREGREEGHREGFERKRVELICRKLNKGKSTEQIAEELEETVEEIQEMVDTAKRFAPEYDISGIMEALGYKFDPRIAFSEKHIGI